MDESKNDEGSVPRTGYCQPPLNTRFQKGQSGNPAGRPKGSRNFATVLKRALAERVVINEGGRRKTVTKLEAAVKQICNKAASGDQAAARQLFALVQIAEQQPPAAESSGNRPEEADDQKFVAALLKRLNPQSEGTSTK